MKTLNLEEMEKVEGGIFNPSCADVGGAILGFGVALMFIPGLLPLGITIAMSSATALGCSNS